MRTNSNAATHEPVTVLYASTHERLLLHDAPPRRGGESRVYAAEDERGRRLAVKVALLPLPAGRWLEEERALLSAIGEDPALAGHVVPVRYHGLWGDRPFLAMDWCPRTVEDVARAEPDLAARLALAARVCEAVAALHAARPGLVHRDVKPTNLLLDDDGRVLLADFGTAHVARVGSTATSTVTCTPGWSPPEQSLPLRRRPDASWDVHALAATVFFLVVGRAPAAPARNAQCLTPDGRRLVAGTLEPGDEVDADLARWLDFGRMHALEPEDRAALIERVGDGPLLRAVADALAPHPADRRGSARSLAEAVAGTRPTGRRPLPRTSTLAVGFALLAFGAGASTLAVRRVEGAHADVVPAEAPSEAYAAARVPAGEGVERPFQLGVTEVTQGLWREVAGQDPASLRSFERGSLGPFCDAWKGTPMVGDDLPVVCVDWLDAVRFANALSARDGLRPAYVVAPRPGIAAPDVAWDPEADGWRLPTEAEWLRAAEGAQVPDGVEPCALGNVPDLARRRVEPGYGNTPCDDGFALLAPVGRFPASAWGVHDLAGNVAEWLWDVATPSVNSPSTVGLWRRTRGEGWLSGNTPYDPGGWPAETRSAQLGLRLARSAP